MLWRDTSFTVSAGRGQVAPILNKIYLLPQLVTPQIELSSMSISLLHSLSPSGLAWFWLVSHGAKIKHPHCFPLYDNRDFCFFKLLSISEKFIFLIYAIVALSMLIHPEDGWHNHNECIFFFYGVAVESFIVALNEIPRDVEEYFALLATALHLLAFEVFLKL